MTVGKHERVDLRERLAIWNVEKVVPKNLLYGKGLVAVR